MINNVKSKPRQYAFRGLTVIIARMRCIPNGYYTHVHY